MWVGLIRRPPILGGVAMCVALHSHFTLHFTCHFTGHFISDFIQDLDFEDFKCASMCLMCSSPRLGPYALPCAPSDADVCKPPPPLGTGNQCMPEL